MFVLLLHNEHMFAMVDTERMFVACAWMSDPSDRVASEPREQEGRPMQQTVASASIQRTGTRDRIGAGGRALRHARRARVSLGSVLAIALIVASLVVAVASVCLRPVSPAPYAWSTITVQPNASLWTLAVAHPVPGLRTIETVRLIAEENGVDPGALRPGQSLRVPSAGATGTAVALR